MPANDFTTIVTLPINPIFPQTDAVAFHDEVATLIEGNDIEVIQ
ncbi:hypothetical protein [Solibacillus sp. CAU 1738]